MNRDKGLWIVGGSVSLFGDGAFWLAVGIWVKDLTGSAAAAGLAMFCLIAPRALSPLTGLLADRFRRRRVLMTVYPLLALLVLSALFVRGADQVWLLYAVLVGLGFGGGVAAAAGSALLTEIVPRDDLGRANSVLRTAKELGLLVAPVAGAGLYAAVGPRPVVLVEAASFLFVAGCVALLRLREPAPAGRSGRLATELVAGLGHLRRTAPLRRMVGATAIAMLAFGVFETLQFAIVDQGLHRPTAFLGVIAVAQGVGAVTSGLIAMRLSGRWSEQRMMVVGLAGAAVGTAVMALPGLPAVLAGTVVFGLSIPIAVIGLFTALQRYTPGALQGRVQAAADSAMTVPQVTSVALGAGLVSVVDYRILLVAMAAVVALSAAWLQFGGQPASGAGNVADRVRDDAAPGDARAARDAVADLPGLEPVGG